MFLEPVISCVILSNKEDPLYNYVRTYVSLSYVHYVVQPRRSVLGSLTYMGSNMDLLVSSGKECVHKEGAVIWLGS